MTMRRSFLAALFTTVAAAAVLPATAGAALTPVFDTPTALGSGSAAANNSRVVLGHGRATAVWLDDLGDGQVIVAATKDGTDDWSEPVRVSDEGETTTSEMDVVADRDGNVTVIWYQRDNWAIHANTLMRSSQSWDGPRALTSHGINFGRLTTTPDGGVAATWGDNDVYILKRAAGSPDWSDQPEGIATDGQPTSVSVDYNASGDAVAVWSTAHPDGDDDDSDSDWTFDYARYSHATQEWSSPQVVDRGSNAQAENLTVTLTPDNHATAAWIDHDTQQPFAASESADRSEFLGAEALTQPGEIGVLPNVASKRNNDVVVVYQSAMWDADFLAMYGSSRVNVRTRSSETGEWSAQQSIIGNRFGGGALMGANDNYDLGATLLAADALDTSRMGDGVIANVDLVFAVMPDGADDFSFQTVRVFDFNTQANVPSGAIDENGNGAVALMHALTGQNRQMYAAVGDATPPELDDVSVPASAKVGTPISSCTRSR